MTENANYYASNIKLMLSMLESFPLEDYTQRVDVKIILRDRDKHPAQVVALAEYANGLMQEIDYLRAIINEEGRYEKHSRERQANPA